MSSRQGSGGTLKSISSHEYIVFDFLAHANLLA